MLKQKGFTLIELMIVVAIIAVLAGIAYPSYIEHVIKTRRVAAAGCMLEKVQFLERYHTTHMKYGGGVPAVACDADVSEYYAWGGEVDEATYTITATPIGSQIKDTKCGELGIDQAGVRTANGSTDAAAACF